MKTLAEMVKAERERQGINQADFAKRVGVSQAVISKIENGTIKQTSHILKLAQVLDVNPMYFATGDDLYYSKFGNGSFTTPNYDKAIYIPIYNKVASMGFGNISDEERIVDHIVVTKAWLRANLPTATSFNNISVIPATGDSMSPTIESGSLLWIDTGVKTVDFDGIYAISMSNRFFVKRIVFNPIKKIFLISSDNPSAGDKWEVDESNHEEFFVHGKVLMTWSPKKV